MKCFVTAYVFMNCNSTILYLTRSLWGHSDVVWQVKEVSQWPLVGYLGKGQVKGDMFMDSSVPVLSEPHVFCNEKQTSLSF